ncbi:MAG: ferritin [Crocinitomicaceae bacterium]|nr:ferritin [Crocinitomicaceae bacterium]
MLNKRVEEALNEQIVREDHSSQLYLAMASWADTNGYAGTSEFLYRHSDEERLHMLKMVRFVNERGGKAIIPGVEKPAQDFASMKQIFEEIQSHEQMITNKINEIVQICLEEKDFTTHNFMQWYVSEQLEEEALISKVLDKLKLAGEDKGALYMFDSDMEKMEGQQSNPNMA